MLPKETEMEDDVVERARELAFAGDFSPDDLGGDIGTMTLRNPDGPELFEIIERLARKTVTEPTEGWQPIETAPEGDEDSGPLFDVTWAGERHRYLPVPRRETDCFKERGVIKRKHGYPSLITVFNPQPTHWMPLPDPPKVEHLSGDGVDA